MMHQHRGLAAGRWRKLSLMDQMAHIGSEVERAISWRAKGNAEISKSAFYRALELLELTIADGKHKDRLRELTRLHEILVDYFTGENQYRSSDRLWHRYFFPFNWAARRHIFSGA